MSFLHTDLQLRLTDSEMYDLLDLQGQSDTEAPQEERANEVADTRKAAGHPERSEPHERNPDRRESAGPKPPRPISPIVLRHNKSHQTYSRVPARDPEWHPHKRQRRPYPTGANRTPIGPGTMNQTSTDVTLMIGITITGVITPGYHVQIPTRHINTDLEVAAQSNFLHKNAATWNVIDRCREHVRNLPDLRTICNIFTKADIVDWRISYRPDDRRCVKSKVVTITTPDSRKGTTKRIRPLVITEQGKRVIILRATGRLQLMDPKDNPWDTIPTPPPLHTNHNAKDNLIRRMQLLAYYLPVVAPHDISMCLSNTLHQFRMESAGLTSEQQVQLVQPTNWHETTLRHHLMALAPTEFWPNTMPIGAGPTMPPPQPDGDIDPRTPTVTGIHTSNLIASLSLQPLTPPLPISRPSPGTGTSTWQPRTSATPQSQSSPPPSQRSSGYQLPAWPTPASPTPMDATNPQPSPCSGTPPSAQDSTWSDFNQDALTNPPTPTETTRNTTPHGSKHASVGNSSGGSSTPCRKTQPTVDTAPPAARDLPTPTRIWNLWTRHDLFPPISRNVTITKDDLRHTIRSTTPAIFRPYT